MHQITWQYFVCKIFALLIVCVLWHFCPILISISLTTRDLKNFLHIYWPFRYLFFQHCLFNTIGNFLWGYVFFLLIFKIFKYVLDSSPLLDRCVINILSYQILCLIFSLSGVPWLIKFLNLMQFIFFSIFIQLK